MRSSLFFSSVGECVLNSKAPEFLSQVANIFSKEFGTNILKLMINILHVYKHHNLNSLPSQFEV